ncbi:MAG: hypothetical protein JNM56_20635 [Planctomycetia bacterium]|nr:hypothetical protein [Planctomycetia bacterium]
MLQRFPILPHFLLKHPGFRLEILAFGDGQVEAVLGALPAFRQRLDFILQRGDTQRRDGLPRCGEGLFSVDELRVEGLKGRLSQRILSVGSFQRRLNGGELALGGFQGPPQARDALGFRLAGCAGCGNRRDLTRRFCRPG